MAVPTMIALSQSRGVTKNQGTQLIVSEMGTTKVTIETDRFGRLTGTKRVSLDRKYKKPPTVLLSIRPFWGNTVGHAQNVSTTNVDIGCHVWPAASEVPETPHKVVVDYVAVTTEAKLK